VIITCNSLRFPEGHCFVRPRVFHRLKP
jgi:hypothetical protein